MIDIHVHYFPPPLFEAIWRFFETAPNGLWRIRYKLHGAEHVQTLRSFGVERFTSLVYAHKPGLADYLNAFVAEAAAEWPDMIPFGTVYAGDGDTGRQAERLFQSHGFLGIKLHPYVSLEDLDDARFFDCYEVMEALGRVLLCHPGSAPVYRDRDGVSRLGRVLTQFPQLKVVVAHCGAYETSAYERLASAYEHVYFDTAMVAAGSAEFPDSPGREFFWRWQDRILYGSDYPNIPYDYERQPAGLQALDLGAAVEQKLFHDNACRLLELEATGPKGPSNAGA